MSKESLNWLSNNVLVGFSEKRGNAWHYRKGDDNHYVGAVPVEDVRKRLFDWTAVEQPVLLGEVATEEGFVFPGEVIPNRKAIVHSHTGKVFGIFTDSYKVHDYEEWLVENVETILDDDLQIGTAGLLRGGGQAWVQVETPETMEFAGGIKARPFLLAAGSIDGSLSSTYGASVTNTVCDNTMNIAMGEHGGFRKKFRHSKNSLGRVSDVREALGVVHTMADDFGRAVTALLDQEVNDRQFLSLLESEVPLPDPKKAAAAHTAATKKREHIFDMYRFDVRVAPWRGTAMGAWQAFSTFGQHESRINKSTNRVERNATWMITGEQEKRDFNLLEKITELA